MSKLFVSKRTRAAAWVILLVLPALMVAFGYYHSHRPAVNPVGSLLGLHHIKLGYSAGPAVPAGVRHPLHTGIR